MNDDPFDELERQLATAGGTGAPLPLRSAVLADVARELRAARWDRRLARTAAVLLMIGVGLNAALVWRSDSASDQRHQLAQQPASNSLVETAIVVAEATDAETGRTFARQLAALTGRELTDQEIATINAARPDRG